MHKFLIGGVFLLLLASCGSNQVSSTSTDDTIGSIEATDDTIADFTPDQEQPEPSSETSEQIMACDDPDWSFPFCPNVGPSVDPQAHINLQHMGGGRTGDFSSSGSTFPAEAFSAESNLPDGTVFSKAELTISSDANTSTGADFCTDLSIRGAEATGCIVEVSNDNGIRIGWFSVNWYDEPTDQRIDVQVKPGYGIRENSDVTFVIDFDPSFSDFDLTDVADMINQWPEL